MSASNSLVRGGLTVQVMIRDEPFAYYAVRSIYDYADVILLYDTGTNDELAKEGIERLLAEDDQNKIRFKLISTRDMQTWVHREVAPDRDKALGAVRQTMIDDTDTEFFMLVDGDEVHYRDGIQRIVKEVIPNWPLDKKVCYIPVRWHSALYETIPVGIYQGRLFRTEDVFSRGAFPGEMHCDKKTGRVMWLRHPDSYTADEVVPFAHFEAYLKPWRREIKRGRRRFLGCLPEVMQDNDLFIRRWEEKVSLVNVVKDAIE